MLLHQVVIVLVVAWMAIRVDLPLEAGLCRLVVDHAIGVVKQLKLERVDFG